MENKTSKYFKYAIGEIILVVVGILIALQINNWNENYKNQKREKAFLINLQADFKADSTRLTYIEETLKTAVKYKKVFENYLNELPTDKDSLNAHLLHQYNILIDFIPNSTTVDELTNSNGFNLISNPLLRRKIVTLYNQYDNLILKLKIGQEKGQTVINYVSKIVNNVNDISENEIMDLLEDKYYINQTRMNYLYTQLVAVEASLQHCSESLKLIHKELNYD
jgi:hypothetical protein